MNFTSIADLKPFTSSPPIKLKVQRIWKSMSPLEPDNIYSLDVLAADSKADVIQCRIKTFDIPIFEDKLQEGCVYIVDQYDVTLPKRNYDVISSQRLIQFRRTTTVKKIEDDPTPYPPYHFNFLPFDRLPEKLNDTAMLSDVIGVIASMTSIERIRLNNRPDDVDRRTISIQDELGQNAQIMLYGDLARCIQPDNIQDKVVNPVLLCAAIVVKSYHGDIYLPSCSATKVFLDLDIPETARLKERYKSQPVVFRYIEPQPQQAPPVNQPIRSITIAEIQKLSPKANTTAKFNLTASITDVKAQFGWHYKGCRQCGQGLELYDTELCCRRHGKTPAMPIYRFNLIIEDNTGKIDVVVFGRQAEQLIGLTAAELLVNHDSDERSLPDPITQLVGDTRTFQVGFTSRAIETDTVSLKLYNSDGIGKRKRHTDQPQQSRGATTSADTPQETPPSPPSKQVCRDLFPDETPKKQPQPRGKDPATPVE